MDTRPKTTRINLAHREIVALADTRGFVIDCLSGQLWITADGVAGDHVLGPGDRLRLTGRPRVFVSGLSAAELRATACCGTSPVHTLLAGCAAAILDSIHRWRHLPLAAYPVTRLR